MNSEKRKKKNKVCVVTIFVLVENDIYVDMKRMLRARHNAKT